MRYRFRPMRWRDAMAVSRWRYPAPYSHYDVRFSQLALELATQKVLGALNLVWYDAVFDERGELAGMFSFARRGLNGIEIGLGMRPDLTGKGLGLDFVLAGLEVARERFHPRRFYLEVNADNPRAAKVYERAGFRRGKTRTLRTLQGSRAVIEMSRDA